MGLVGIFVMNKVSRWLRASGFSLVELMAVVTVIGILVALALPRFRIFIARSRQAEASANLGVIHKLQKSVQGFGADGVYHGGLMMGLGNSGGTCSDDSAGTKNSLGFRVEDCDKLRYTYSSAGGGGHAVNNNPAGRQIYPNCASSTTPNLAPLVAIAQCLGSTDTACASQDVNGDNVINILDLGLAAATLVNEGGDGWAIDRASSLRNIADVVEGCAD